MTSNSSQTVAQPLDNPVITSVPAAPVRQEFYVKSPLLDAKAQRLAAAKERMDEEIRRRVTAKVAEARRQQEENKKNIDRLREINDEVRTGEDEVRTEKKAETTRVVEEKKKAGYSRAAEDFVFHTLKENLRKELAASGVPEDAIDDSRFEGSPLDGAVRAVMPVGITITPENFHQKAQRAVALTDAALDKALPKVARETIIAKNEALADAPDALTAVEIRTAADAEGVERASKTTATLSAAGLSRFAAKMLVRQAAAVGLETVLPGLAVARAATGAGTA